MTFFYWKHKAKLELTRKKMYTANALVLWRHPVLLTNCINPSWSFRLPIGNPKKCYPWSFFKPSCTIYHTTTHWHCSWTKDLTDPLLNLLRFHSEADRFSLRSTNFLTLKKNYARTNVLKYSFFHRIIDQWNQLPLDIRVSDDVNIFKTRVKKFLGDF